MKIDIDDEVIDGLVKSVIKNDYRLIKENAEMLQAKKALCANSDLELPKYEQEDLDHNIELIQAFEVIIEYYVGFDWKSEI